MPKPQLAYCPFGICKRLATKKSYSILWPPWKATRSLLRTHLLFRGNAFKNGVYSPCLSEHCTKCQSKPNGHDPGSSLQTKKTHSCKWIQDRLGIWIPRRGFQIPGTGFLVFFSVESNCKWNSGFLELYSGLQSPGFRIQIALIPESVFPYMWRKNR